MTLKGERTGVNNPFYGRRHSEESRKKMSDALRGKPRKRGHHHSEETKEKIRQTRLGEKNWMWKGDDVGYKVLHKWVRRYLPRPEFCVICKNVRPYEVANISGKYLRDLTDWQWLCRKCHMTSDGRLEKLNERWNISH